MMDLQAESNLSNCLARLTNILNSVADTHVGKTKPRRKAKLWMTPDVRAKIQTHHRLQRTLKKPTKMD